MFYLGLTILFITGLFISFKLFPKYGIDTHEGITANYLAFALLAFLFTENKSDTNTFVDQDWFVHSVALGICFISTFFLIGTAVIRLGASVASIANNMSLVIPVSLAFILYDESITLLKVTGIIITLISLYLVSSRENTHITSGLLTLIVFIISGIVDAYINFVNVTYISKEDIPNFITVQASTAFVSGFLVLVYRIIRKNKRLHLKSWIAGVLLGCINFFSVYYLYLALDGMEGSIFFPLKNLGVVLLTTVISVGWFKEHLNKRNWIGIGLSLLAILILSL